MDASERLPEFAAASGKKKSCSISDSGELGYDPQEEFFKFLEEARRHANEAKNTDNFETCKEDQAPKVEEQNMSWWKKILLQLRKRNNNNNHRHNNNGEEAANKEQHQHGNRSRLFHFQGRRT